MDAEALRSVRFRFAPSVGAFALCLCLPALCAAQVPAGSEFVVHAFTFGGGVSPASAFAENGDFVVVWDAESATGPHVRARRYDAAGAPLGTEFQVSANTGSTNPGAFAFPSTPVASRPDGRFVVVWTGRDQDGDQGGVFGQRFDARGNRIGAEFQVNFTTTGHQANASVAIAPGGDYVVVWNGEDAGQFDIFARAFDAAGNPRSGELRVNTSTAGAQRYPDVAMDASGRAVVAWTDENGYDGSGFGVFARLLGADATPLGPEFQVNTYTTSGQTLYGVARAGDGRFVVIWERLAATGRAVFVSLYDAGGVPTRPEFQANQDTSQLVSSSVSIDREGNFVVAWRRRAIPNAEMHAQRFSSAGARRGNEFLFGFGTPSGPGFERPPDVAIDAAGNFLVAWEMLPIAGPSRVMARRYGGLLPAALAVDSIADADSDGNGVLEPGEAVDVAPAWRNVNGAAQTISGGLGSAAGPGGPAITDDAADYGAIPNAATGNCSDCYTVSVANPAPRPATHWDVTALETLVPDAHGQVKRWSLHVGDSFADVPRSSAFYRFVETLLHRGATTGCASSAFCPAAPLTREQLAVLALVVKEGPGYRPPSCGVPPMFGDVASASPFCPWVEELARRGVVAGCGGGNYCPAAPVSREQMPVFVLRTLDTALVPPPCIPPNLYGDVPETSPFCAWIEELTIRGVVNGCGGGNYCPAAPVTREQVAVFLAGTFSLGLYGP